MQKTGRLYELCHTDERYFDRWEALSKTSLTDKQSRMAVRVERAKTKIAEHNRFINWIKHFRKPSDRGLGDTAQRLLSAAKPRHTISKQLHILLTMHSCTRRLSMQNLNDEHPYPKQKQIAPRGYCTPHLVAVTSLAPRECSRQTAALNSWTDFGLEIHAVNTSVEIETLKPLYPQVDQWHIQDEVSVGFSKPTQLIYNLAQIAIELHKTILIINADIELIGNPDKLIKRLGTNKLLGCIRHNYTRSTKHSTLEPHGIDAFVITPKMAATLPRATMAIGQPMWDYWIPHHFRDVGYDIDLIGEPLLFHKSHSLQWNTMDWIRCARRLKTDTGIDLESTALQFRRSLPYPPVKTNKWE